MKLLASLCAAVLVASPAPAATPIGALLGLDFDGHGTVDASEFSAFPVGTPVAVSGYLRFATPFTLFDDTDGTYYFGGYPDEWSVRYGLATVWSLMSFPTFSLTVSGFTVSDFSFGGVISGDQLGEVTRTTFLYGEFDPGDGTPTGTASGHWTIDHFTTEIVVIDRVPEPSTWLLLAGGFGIAGALVRRRRGMAVLAH